MIKLFAFITVFVLLSACDSGTPQRKETLDGGYNVQTLFTYDGCTVYKFYDGMHYRYFTNCSGSTSYNASCGKNCIYKDGVMGGNNE